MKLTRSNSSQMNHPSSARSLFEWIDARLLRAPSIVGRAVQSFNDTYAAESAASVAFYALFSLFPLLIFLVAFTSSIYLDEPVQQTILNFVGKTLPAAQDLVRSNIEASLQSTGTVQIVSSIGLLWAASGVFNLLAHNINRAWHIAEARNFVVGRLIALGMVAILTILVILWIGFTTVVNILSLFEIPIFGGRVDIYDTYLWSIVSQFVPSFFLFMAVLNLYRWVPKTKVRWREATIGALVAVTFLELTTAGFRWYLSSGLSRYTVVYGSLGAVVALMLWLYLGSLVVLFGAHLSAAIAFQTRLKDKS